MIDPTAAGIPALSLVDLAAAIRDGAVSSEDAVLACLDRIDAVNPALNAVVQLRREAAIDEARVADTMPREQRGPLHGVPVTIKDSLDTAGTISTAGTQGRVAYVPAADATVVARLRAAGAIVLGKTNTPDITLWGETGNLVYGRTNNPYDVARTPGGSSGGAAAIIATGGSPLDIGSDTGGSVRMPAHFCGIAGIKPTAGRVPRTGHIIDHRGIAQSLTHLGPLARRVDDLALALALIAGPDDVDPYTAPVPLGDYRAVDVRGLHIAHFTTLGALEPTRETARAVARAVAAMKDAGCRVTEVTIPNPQEIYAGYMALVWSDGGAGVASILARAHTTESLLIEKIAQAPTDERGQVTARIERVDAWRSEMLAFFAGYDGMICPVYPEPAPLHGGWVREKAAYSQLFNLTGWPSTTVRAGTSPEGLPIGVQCAARPWRDDVSLAVARHIEASLGAWPPPPMW